MGGSIRVTTRRVFVGNTAVCPLTGIACNPTQSEWVLGMRTAGDVSPVILRPVQLRADKVAA